MSMLEIKDLEVYYGVIQAIKGISFTVNEGEVIALIGANGAGKTSLIRRNGNRYKYDVHSAGWSERPGD